MRQLEVNRERLAALFTELVQIDSISREEGRLARVLCGKLEALGVRTHIDRAGEAVGGETGNIIGLFPGTRSAEPLILAAHMDTVEPGRGVRPQLTDGVFTSDGSTILGADDKSAIAILLEVLNCIQEQRLACGPLELIFTICEEVGLLGAKHLDYGRVSARMGYALDTRNPRAIITRAPSANRLTFRVHGKAAHAGSAPENGINAISLASKAIAQLQLGRIDFETTCNIGLIEGGRATNIVPESVTVMGEVRSHDKEKLKRITGQIIATFESAVGAYQAGDDLPKPSLETEVDFDFDVLRVADDHQVVSLARAAAGNLGYTLDTASSGGGSDANVFARRGIVVPVLGTGMENVHTVKESIRLADMENSVRLVLEILRLHAEAFNQKDIQK